MHSCTHSIHIGIGHFQRGWSPCSLSFWQVLLKTDVFWHVMQCWLVNTCQCFKRLQYFYFQDQVVHVSLFLDCTTLEMMVLQSFESLELLAKWQCATCQEAWLSEILNWRFHLQELLLCNDIQVTTHFLRVLTCGWDWKLWNHVFGGYLILLMLGDSFEGKCTRMGYCVLWCHTLTIGNTSDSFSLYFVLLLSLVVSVITQPAVKFGMTTIHQVSIFVRPQDLFNVEC
jgi:hypothetical protein